MENTMFGYKCFAETHLIWVRHVDTGYEIVYHRSKLKTRQEIKHFQENLVYGEGFSEEEAEEEARTAWEKWACMGRLMRAKIMHETIERDNMHTHTVTGMPAEYIADELIPPKTVSTCPAGFSKIKPIDCYTLKPFAKGCNKEEKKMGYNTAAAVINAAPSDESIQRDHLESRLFDIHSTKAQELRKKFNIDSPYAPNTLEDLIDRIKNNKFTMPDEKELKRKSYIDSLVYNIDWRTTPADIEGFEAAKVLLKKAYVETKDAIIIKSPAEGLDALKAFEAQTF